ncbi:MAG: serine/threonine-protein kinase, partial [Polyangia bacterium]
MPPEPRMDALVGAVLEGAYRITRLIGEGGMGAVYEAVQLRLNKRVAIKLMARDLASNREALARFRREAEITSHLGHPHLVSVVDFGQAESGEPYLVMEYLEGEDLDHRLRRVGRMSIEAVVHVVRQVASALNAAHDQGVVHRDLKPGNVFLVQIPGEPDFVKILDFGISKMKAARTQLTSASAVMGTPNYMSPEQATGMLEEVDHRTDQWSLACIAWEMLLGRGPFVADEVAALLYQIINLDPHPLAQRVPGLPPAVETALRRALRKKPAERFSSMREFSRELEAAAFGRPADVTPTPVLVSSIAPPTSPTIGYSATQVPPTPVRQPAARA